MSSPSTATGTATGVIHDIGYRRYEGPRLGRGYRLRSLYVHGLRTSYGLGRGVVAKIFTWGPFIVLVAIAAIFAAIRSQVGDAITTYWEFPVLGLNLLVLLFCAVAAPELVSRDLRSGVLQLYFSRPLTRTDYPIAKWASLVSALFLLVLAPELVLFLGGAFGTTDLGLVWDETVELSKGLVVAAVLALLYGSISLLISSLSRRWAVAAALTVAVFILTTPLVGILEGMAWVLGSSDPNFDGQLTGGPLQLSQLASLASPLTMTEGFAVWLFGNNAEQRVGPFGPVYAGVIFGIVVLCLLLTLLRYRKVAR